MPLERAIIAYIKGNNEALALLFEQEFEKLLFYAYRFLADREAASDQTAALFDKLLQWSPKERQEKLPQNAEAFSKVIYRIHKNACLDYLRHLKVEQKHKNTNGFSKAASINAENELWVKESLEFIKNHLSERENEVLQLSMEGYTSQEIANRLEVNQKTVQNTLLNSRNKVKELMPSIVNFDQ